MAAGLEKSMVPAGEHDERAETTFITNADVAASMRVSPQWASRGERHPEAKEEEFVMAQG